MKYCKLPPATCMSCGEIFSPDCIFHLDCNPCLDIMHNKALHYRAKIYGGQNIKTWFEFIPKKNFEKVVDNV